MEKSSRLRSPGSRRVLVVDDHSINREFLKSALALEAFEVEEASSGPDAIARCRLMEYDLILMDLHMPGQDGIETAKAIQALNAGSAKAGVIFLTADTRPEVHEQLSRAGFDRVLNKPLNVDTLIARLRGWDMLDCQSINPPRPSGTGLLIDDTAALATCNGQHELVARMKRMFADDLDQRLNALDQQIARGDQAAAATILHQWTGAASYAGASKLADRIQRLQSTLHDQPSTTSDRAELADTYLAFMRCARDTRAALSLDAPSQA